MSSSSDNLQTNLGLDSAFIAKYLAMLRPSQIAEMRERAGASAIIAAKREWQSLPLALQLEFLEATKAWAKYLAYGSDRLCILRLLATGVRPGTAELAQRDRIWQKLGGQAEVACPAGRIDLLTSDCIYEFKTWQDYKGALGQVLSYAVYFPRHRRAIVLLGAVPYDQQANIRLITKAYDVKVYLMIDDDCLREL